MLLFRYSVQHAAFGSIGSVLGSHHWGRTLLSCMHSGGRKSTCSNTSRAKARRNATQVPVFNHEFCIKSPFPLSLCQHVLVTLPPCFPLSSIQAA